MDLKRNNKMTRKNKSKEEIMTDIKQREKVAHIKEVVKKVYPLLAVDTIYDAQTVLNAIQGFIKVDLEERLDAIKLSDLKLDFSKESDSKIKTAMEVIVKELADEPADEFSQTIERLARAFSDFGAQKFLKNDMSSLKIEEILAE